MKNSITVISWLFLPLSACFFVSLIHAQQEKDSTISLVGVYEYIYEYNTADLVENHYLDLFRSNGKVAGYYFGTSDDFDEAREGYLPGFFSAKIKNLNVTDSTFHFEIEVENKHFFTKPITPFGKTENNSFWDMQIRHNKRKYRGEIKNRKIIIHTENFEPRVFRKIKN